MNRKPYKPQPAPDWKADRNTHAAASLDAWRDFHMKCYIGGLFFDHVVSDQGYRCFAHTAERTKEEKWTYWLVAEGRGDTPIDALVDAYQKAGMPIEDAEPFLEELSGASVPTDAEIEEIEKNNETEMLLGSVAEELPVAPAVVEEEDLIG